MKLSFRAAAVLLLCWKHAWGTAESSVRGRRLQTFTITDNSAAETAPLAGSNPCKFTSKDYIAIRIPRPTAVGGSCESGLGLIAASVALPQWLGDGFLRCEPTVAAHGTVF